ncbi:MAG TPA: hypothetical protein DEG69_21500 [Flavobacteriaceae bacterium]|nr:hypothetical protein [Flavobacteriaceae bacterium]
MNNNFNQVKEWFTFVVSVVIAIAGIIFWVQSVGDDRINRIEAEVKELKSDMKEITKQNSKILRLIGRIEGSMIKK